MYVYILHFCPPTEIMAPVIGYTGVCMLSIQLSTPCVYVLYGKMLMQFSLFVAGI